MWLHNSENTSPITGNSTVCSTLVAAITGHIWEEYTGGRCIPLTEPVGNVYDELLMNCIWLQIRIGTWRTRLSLPVCPPCPLSVFFRIFNWVVVGVGVMVCNVMLPRHSTNVYLTRSFLLGDDLETLFALVEFWDRNAAVNPLTQGQ